MTLTATKKKGRVGQIAAHPLRAQCFTALTEREASPAELARRLGRDQGTVSYHVKKLLAAGAIEEISSAKNNGGTERFYRAIQRPLVSDEESAAMPADERTKWTELILGLIAADATASMLDGTFSKRPDHNIVRFPTSVDEQGWKDLGRAAEEFLERCMDIEAESAGRGGGDIRVRVVSLVHEVSS